MATAGQRPHFVTLQDRRDAGVPVVFSPDTAWVALRPEAPGLLDEAGALMEVEMDYHPQVTTETRLVMESGRHLWVKGVQNVDEQNRVLRLLCEEVKTP